MSNRFNSIIEQTEGKSSFRIDKEDPIHFLCDVSEHILTEHEHQQQQLFKDYEEQLAKWEQAIKSNVRDAINLSLESTGEKVEGYMEKISRDAEYIDERLNRFEKPIQALSSSLEQTKLLTTVNSIVNLALMTVLVVWLI